MTDRVQPGRGRRKLQTARERLDVIVPMLEYRRLSRLGQAPLIPGLIRTMEDVASCIALRRGISRSTLWRWYMLFQRSGCEGLADRPRSDKGKAKFFSSNPAAREFVLSRFLSQGLSRTQVYRALRNEWGGKPPCYKTVLRYLKPLVQHEA